MSERREWTAERHAAAWDRCNRATSGPWKRWTSNSHRRLTAEDQQDGGVAYGTKHKDGCDDIVIGEHDMAFIEEARLDLPDALREIERLTSDMDTSETCRESLRKGLGQASDQIAEMTAEAKGYRAEIERLRAEAESDRGMYAAQLANVANERDNLRIQLQNERSSPVWAIVGEVQAALGLPRGALLGEVVAAARDLARGRRKAAQALTAEIGVSGPENIEETAERAVAEIRRLNAELAARPAVALDALGERRRIEALAQEHFEGTSTDSATWYRIRAFMLAMGPTDVPQAPSGQRALTDASIEDEIAEFERDASTAPDAWPNPLVRRLAAALRASQRAEQVAALREELDDVRAQRDAARGGDAFTVEVVGTAPAGLESKTAQETAALLAAHGPESLHMERARAIRRICYGGEPDFFMQEDGKPWTTIVRFCDASRPAEDPLTIPLSRYADGLEQVAAQAGRSVATADKLLRAVTAIRCAISGKPIDARIADALRELAFAICAVQARDPDQKAQLRRVAEAHDTLRYTLGDHNPDPTADDDANRSTLTEEQDEIASALKALGARPDLTLGEAIARFKARHALRTPLTNEQLDVLARAMPDVVDYERATPEQRRETVLDVLAIHGPRPIRSPLSDADAENTARRLLAEMGIRDDAHVDRIARALQDVADGGRGHCDGSKRKAAIAVDREALGRLVREVWVECASEQPNPKPAHLVPWEGLDDWNKEVDRRIGERVAREALASRPALTERDADDIELARAVRDTLRETTHAGAIERLEELLDAEKEAAARPALTEEKARRDFVATCREAHARGGAYCITTIGEALSSLDGASRASRGETGEQSKAVDYSGDKPPHAAPKGKAWQWDEQCDEWCLVDAKETGK